MLRDIAVVRNRKKLNGERLKKHRVALEYWDFEDNLGDFLAPVIVEWMLAQKGMNLQTICAGKKHLMAVGLFWDWADLMRLSGEAVSTLLRTQRM